MSKKPEAVAPVGPTPAHVSPVAATVAVIPQELVDEAMTRFSPFVFTFSTDTRDNVDFSAVVAQLQREPTIAANFFLVDKADACQAVATSNPAAVADPLHAALVPEVKTNLVALTAEGASLTAEQSALVAQCVRYKITQYAVGRESARREEQRLLHQQHLELVERFIEEGMKPSDAERAALEEEEAAAAQSAAAGDGAVDERPLAFVLLRGGFPSATQDLLSMAKYNVPLHSVLSINTLAKFGIKKEDAAAGAQGGAAAGKGKDAGGTKKGGAPDLKKPDPKKAPGKGGKDDLGGAIVVDSLPVALKKEQAKLPRLAPAHPFLQSELWSYQVPSTETSAIDESTGLKIHDAAQPEAQTMQIIVERVLQLEQYYDTYRTWCQSKTLRHVGKLHTKEDAQAEETRQLAAAQEAKLAAEASAKVAVAPAKKGGKTVVGKGGPAEEVVKEEVTVVQSHTSTLPKAVSEIPFASDAYNGFLHTLPLAEQCKPAMMLDALVAQMLHSAAVCSTSSTAAGNSSAAAGTGTATAVPSLSLQSATTTTAPTKMNTPRNVAPGAAAAGSAMVSPRGGAVVSPAAVVAAPVVAALPAQAQENIAQLKRDVADYADFMLAQLDGNQKDVFEAARVRRLHPAGTATIAAAPETLSECHRVFAASPKGAGAQTPQEVAFTHKLVTTLLPLHEDRAHDASTIESIAKACELARVKMASETSGSIYANNNSMLSSLPLTHWELLNDRQCAQRLQRALLLCDGATRGSVTELSDGAKVVLVERPVDTDVMRRWMSTWSLFHGLPTYAQWLRLAEFVAKENLHYFPPPKDEDEEEDEGAAAANRGGGAAAAEEEEEEDEEEEEELDENGDLVVKPKKKKEKKIVHIDPEFIDINGKEVEAQRRRNTLEHVQRVLDAHVEEVLYANNHTSSSVYAEEHLMFPDDGSVIAVSDTTNNTSAVDCTVQSVNCIFGFRASRSPKDTTTTTTTSGIPSGVRACLSMDCGVNVTAEISMQRKPGTSTAAPSVVASTVVSPRDAATTVVMAPGDQPMMSPHENLFPVTTVVAAAKDFTVSVDSVARCITLTRPASAQAPINKVLLYHQATSKEGLCVVGKEIHRSVLANGTLAIHYDGGCVQHLKYDGSWASFSPAAGWLHCNAKGQHLARSIHGTVRELPPSLSATRVDPVTNARITERDDGTVRVDFNDGDRSVVAHSNGTNFWIFPHRVEIHCVGYPRVCFPKSIHGEKDTEQLTVVFPNRFFFSWTPTRRVVFGHEPSAIQSIVSFDTCRMHVLPSPESRNEYVVDVAFGGLRVADTTTAFHVTPHGRSRCKPIRLENPTPPTDFTVKQIVETFITDREVISSEFTDAMKHADHFAFHNTLHLLAQVSTADPEEWVSTGAWQSTRSLTLPQKEKELQTASCLKKLLPAEVPAGPSPFPPVAMLVILPDGKGALEAHFPGGLQSDVRNILLTSDLIQSHVHEIPLAKKSKTDSKEKTKQEESQLKKWHALALCMSPLADTSVPPMPPLARSSAHINDQFDSLSDFVLSLQHAHHETSKTLNSPQALEGRFFLVRDENRKSASTEEDVPLRDVLSVFDRAFDRALEDLSSCLPPSLRSFPSDAQKSGGGPAHSSAIKPSTGGAERSNTINELHRTAANSQPAVYNFWHSHQPCLDIEADKNRDLKKKLREEKEDGQRRREAYELSVKQQKLKTTAREEASSQGNAGNEKQAPTTTPGGAAVPVYVPLYQNPHESDMHVQHNQGGAKQGAATAATIGGTTATGASSRKQHALSKPRLVATPVEVEFGTLMEGFRYMTSIQLTNVSAVSSRFRVIFEEAQPEQQQQLEGGTARRRHATHYTWLSVEYPKAGLAPGMSCPIDVEVDGNQPVGEYSTTLVVMYDGGSCDVPLHIATRAGTERPVSQQRSNVRMIGPSPLQYVPGQSTHQVPSQGGPSSNNNKGRAAADNGNDSD